MGLRDVAYAAYDKRLARSLATSSAAGPRHVGVILDGNRRWAKAVGASYDLAEVAAPLRRPVG